MTTECFVYYPKYCLTIQDIFMLVANIQTKAKVRNGGFKKRNMRTKLCWIFSKIIYFEEFDLNIVLFNARRHGLITKLRVSAR